MALATGCGFASAADTAAPEGPAGGGVAAEESLSAVRVNGVELHYQARGRGEPIVFVHGSLVDYREWEPVAERLENGFRTVRYSRRYNHPNTNPIVGADHSARIEADDLAALVEALQLGPVHVVGVSYGAYTALLATLRHPELVRSLTIVEPPLLRWVPTLGGGKPLYDDFFAMWRASGDAFRRGDSNEALHVALVWFLGADGIGALSADDMAVLTSNIEEWRALTTSSDAFPPISAAQVHGIAVPVLMISGGRSYPILKLVDAEIERQLVGGRRIIVPDATHDVCSEQPEVCAGAIRDFLGTR